MAPAVSSSSSPAMTARAGSAANTASKSGPTGSVRACAHVSGRRDGRPSSGRRIECALRRHCLDGTGPSQCLDVAASRRPCPDPRRHRPPPVALPHRTVASPPATASPAPSCPGPSSCRRRIFRSSAPSTMTQHRRWSRTQFHLDATTIIEVDDRIQTTCPNVSRHCVTSTASILTPATSQAEISPDHASISHGSDAREETACVNTIRHPLPFVSRSGPAPSTLAAAIRVPVNARVTSPTSWHGVGCCASHRCPCS